MARQRSKKPRCGTPEKIRYATEEAAQEVVARTAVPMRTYSCACGWIHLTKKDGGIGAALYEINVLAEMNEVDFAATVDAELLGSESVSARMAKALRAQRNVERWRILLTGVLAKADHMLAASDGDGSREAGQRRRQARTVQAAARMRLAEIEELYRSGRVQPFIGMTGYRIIPSGNDFSVWCPTCNDGIGDEAGGPWTIFGLEAHASLGEVASAVAKHIREVHR